MLKYQRIKDRKRKLKSLKIKVHKSNWNEEKQFVYKKEPNAELYNEKIQEALKDAFTEGDEYLKKKEAKEPINLIEFGEKVIDSIHTISTKRSKIHALNKLQEYLALEGRKDIPLEDIDILFVRGYYSWLLNIHKVEPSTANEYVTVFKYIINQAIEAGIVTYNPHPFAGLKKKKVTKKYNVLDDKELVKLMEFEPQFKSQKDFHRLFFCMMHLAGIRISDILLLQFKNVFKDGDKYYIAYNIKKTGVFVQTRLTLDALQYLFYFVKRYSKGYDKKFRDFSKEKSMLLSQMADYEMQLEEYKDIDEVYKFDALQWEYHQLKNEGKDVEWGDLVNQYVQREKKHNELKYNLMMAKEALVKHNHTMYTYLGEELMKVKKTKPNDTIIPFMNDHYNGETILSEEQTERLHNFKVQSNNTLKSLKRKAKIEGKLSNHMARHIFAQRLFLSGANIHYISMALGHSSLTNTEKYREQLVTSEAMDVTEEFALSFY
ncbi:site-specific integrase [Gramella jeungdoensis]|nr:site-specific integrase [Gramella jeungdoensis]